MSDTPGLKERIDAKARLFQRQCEDNRPDLVEDSDRWMYLLTAVHPVTELWEVLHTLRAFGGRLTDEYRIERGECPPDDYTTVKNRLAPMREELVEGLRLARFLDPATGQRQYKPAKPSKRVTEAQAESMMLRGKHS